MSPAVDSQAVDQNSESKRDHKKQYKGCSHDGAQAFFCRGVSDIDIMQLDPSSREKYIRIPDSAQHKISNGGNKYSQPINIGKSSQIHNDSFWWTEKIEKNKGIVI